MHDFISPRGLQFVLLELYETSASRGTSSGHAEFAHWAVPISESPSSIDPSADISKALRLVRLRLCNSRHLQGHRPFGCPPEWKLRGSASWS